MTQREKLIDLMCNAKRDDSETGSFCEWLADYLLAHNVVVLPCKVGDTLYLPDGRRQEVYAPEAADAVQVLYLHDEAEKG